MRSKLGKNNQQWLWDYIIKTTGKTAHFELDSMLEKLPVEVKSWDMIPKFLGKKAAREEEFGRRAEEAGHFKTAWEAYTRAYLTYFSAQHAICEDDNSQKIGLYERLLHCHEKVRKYGNYPIEKIEIPWGDKTIPALLHLVPDKKKAPCIVHIPGMDRGKECFPHTPGALMDNPFLQRGLHVLVIDGPGQGECNLRKIKVCPDNHKETGKAAIDYLMTRPEISSSIYGTVLLSVTIGVSLLIRL